MEFKTIEEYNEDVKDMEENLKKMEELIEKHSDKEGLQGNYETYKYAYDILKKDRIRFIDNINQINLQFDDDLEKGGLTITEFHNLTTNFNKMINLAAELFSNKNLDEDLFINEIKNHHYKITLSFLNPTEDDVKQTTARKKGLLKIFDLFECKDDLENLKKEDEINEYKILVTYKEFLKEIVKQDRGFILDTEMETLKAGLTLEQCKNICENLKFN